jgi:transcriptional regulator with XRE-family HTH domain
MTPPDSPADPFSTSLAATLHAARAERELSVNALATASGVSRAMIGKIEHGDVQPTAVLLGRLSAALGLTLSELIARAEGERAPRLVRAADHPTWTDPGTGYLRRAVSPRTSGPIQLVEVVLPPGAEVTYPADAYTLRHHQIWVLDGRLDVDEGDDRHVLLAGDCLELGEPAPCTYRNASGAPCRYLVALARRPAPAP